MFSPIASARISNKRSYDDLQQQSDSSTACSPTVAGKWTVEEEQFAWKLINEFEMGLLSKLIVEVAGFIAY
jgi:hypothetical protein